MKGQKIKELYFGGDYNPDQWDEATIRKDMEYFKKCHINYVALPVFSWAKLEPEEGVYNFVHETSSRSFRSGRMYCTH